MTWTPIPVVGGSSADDARLSSFQDTMNWLPVRMERPGGRADWILRSTPGMTAYGDVGTGPIRGDRNVEGIHFVVSGTTLYRVSDSGVGTALGTIPGEGRVSLTHNQEGGGYTLAVFNGPQGYTYNTVTGVFAQITDEGFPGFRVGGFLDGFIVGIENAGLFAAHSDLANAGEYNTIDRYEAEAAPDLLVGQIVNHSEWWLMGRRTIEVYGNTGATTGTFQRIPGSTIEQGLAAPFAVATLDNSVFLLGADGNAYRSDGYNLARISTQTEEQQFAKCDLSQAFAFTFEDRGHKVFYLTFPDGYTHGYDVASREWSKRKSYGLNSWRIATLTRVGSRWIAGDRFTGKLYTLDWDAMEDDGGPLVSERITGILHNNGDKLVIDGLMLNFDTGRPQVPQGRWIGIADSDHEYAFASNNNDTASLSGSVVSVAAEVDQAIGWEIEFAGNAPTKARVTVDSYENGTGSAELSWDGPSGPLSQSNTADDIALAFEPSPVEMNLSSVDPVVAFDANDSGEEGDFSAQFLVEAWDPRAGSDDHHVQLRASRDGGYTWSDWKTRSIGATGQFALPAIFRRLGVSRQWLVHIRVSSPVKRDLIAASIQMRGGA